MWILERQRGKIIQYYTYTGWWVQPICPTEDIAITRVKVSKFKPSTRHGTVVKQWLHSTVVQDNEVCTTAVSNTGNLRYCMVQSKVKACHSKVKRFVFYGNEECACRYTYYKPAQNMKHSYNGIPAGGTSCLHLVHNVSISLQGSTRTCGPSVVPICNLKPWTVFQSKDFLCGTFSNVFQLHFKSVRDQPLFSQTSRCFPSTHLPTKIKKSRISQ